ncbi:MAG: hypothetical protein K8953_05615, partial [Proteobacteria bacterium]|nr:hypothetical protein [Pseudomonadota bacterium]
TQRDTRFNGCYDGSITDRCDGPTAIVCIATGEPFNQHLCNASNEAHARAQRDYCHIRANAGPVIKPNCVAFLGGRTTATMLRAQTIELNATPSTTEQKNEFLRGTDDGLNTDGFLQKDGRPAQVATINMRDAAYEGVRLGGDVADGIAFFAGRAPTGTGSTLRIEYYAGILAGADLGEALKREVGASVDWYGAVNWAIVDTNSKGFVYQSRNTTNRTPRDFVLTIDLGARTFSSFFERGGTAQGFELEGGYDETTGVITNGKVYFGDRSGSTVVRGVSPGGYHFTGPLIGIIGTEGALGVFHAITNATANQQGESLSGGFVARPPRGDYLSWTRAADALASAGAGDGVTNYLRGGAGALDVGDSGISYTLTLADNYSLEGEDHRIVTLGGNVADGVSLAVNELNGNRLYSGLLAGTDVGAPLTPQSAANYQGRIGILIRKGGKTTYDVAHDFTLDVSFGAGSFTSGGATFKAGILTLSGGRFNQFGLISGRVTLTTLTDNSTGTLSGLIGAEGVVGSFISTTHTAGAFAGGFVARADVTSTTPNLRDTAAWVTNGVRNDGTTPLPILADGAAIQAAIPFANFAKVGAGGLDFGSSPTLRSLTLTLGGDYTSDLGDTLSLGGDATDGVTFTSATVRGATRRYVGLLSTISLGQPVSNTDATGTWVGRFALLKDGLNGGAPYISDLVLTVNFRDRMISSPPLAIPFVSLADGVAGVFGISGRYDGHGLIRGTVRYTNTAGGGC